MLKSKKGFKLTRSHKRGSVQKDLTKARDKIADDARHLVKQGNKKPHLFGMVKCS
jgi:hypothetical protein